MAFEKGSIFGLFSNIFGKFSTHVDLEVAEVGDIGHVLDHVPPALVGEFRFAVEPYIQFPKSQVLPLYKKSHAFVPSWGLD